jgi:hypothetical protein
VGAADITGERDHKASVYTELSPRWINNKISAAGPGQQWIWGMFISGL